MVQIGRALYKPFFTMLASTLGLNLSARIRTQVSHNLHSAYIHMKTNAIFVKAYSLLSDAAAECSGNRDLLKQKNILGG
jgi:hypothetical protein